MNSFFDFWVSSPPLFEMAGTRIVVRTPHAADWAAWHELRAQSRAFLQPWEPTWADDALTKPAFRRRLRQYATEWQRDEGYSFLIFAKDPPGGLVGGIALTNIRRGVADSGMIGYWMGQDFAGHGHMSEALPLVLNFAFEKLALHRVEAACLEHNERSQRLLLKSGFRQEGYARGFLRIDGVWRDHLTFGILREDLPR